MLTLDFEGVTCSVIHLSRAVLSSCLMIHMHYTTIVTRVVLGRFAFSGASEETIPKHDEINALVKYRILSLNTYKHRSSIGISFIMSFQFSPSSKAQV